MDARAYWITRDTLLWNVHLPKRATLTLEGLPLELDLSGLDENLRKRYPHLRKYSVYHLPPAVINRVPDLLKGPLMVMACAMHGRVIDSTGVQIPGVLDDLYHYDGPLGITFEGDTPTLRVWAPTARAVRLHLCSSPDAKGGTPLLMQHDPITGVWSIRGTPDWKWKYYRYEVGVYVPSTGKIEHNLVTDPYSVSLSTNSRYSQIVDLSDPALQPPGWRSLRAPFIAAPEDMAIYELHVRDFSMSDESVPIALRGSYRAFTLPHSHGMMHLRSLASAGLTHIHLLPVFDFATVDDDRSTWKSVDSAVLRTYRPDSEFQAHAVQAIQNVDGYNWGYDPYHFTVPEGSYATNPQGSSRILEFREMVQALNCLGLRVVMDVVYNHTNSYGQSEKSVLDRIVPGYYYRWNAQGDVETSTCCPNTATEHAMMRKLMIDSILTWATAYKISGFRFDLMGHHMKADIEAVRKALNSLKQGKDGVNGRKIYIYGEGWDFGEVAGNNRGVNASQQNIVGTGVGTFNDRLRDGIRGGAPFDHPQLQGFATGLYHDPNGLYQGEAWEQSKKLLTTTDWIRIGLAGNLKNFRLVNAQGQTVTGRQIEYRGHQAGYTHDPGESINYASAHDNETLFDAVQLKAPLHNPMEARVRMHALALSLVMLGQGIPFFLAGDDLLRSKSLDRNSFNSGDWFNALDFSMQTSNWGVGLPPGENIPRWNMLRPLLANPSLKPGRSDIQWMVEYFRELLRIRKSSILFRLRTARQVQECLSFFNTGPHQIPGLIVMHLKNSTLPGVPPHVNRTKTEQDPFLRITNNLIVLFNAAPTGITFTLGLVAGKDFALHPIQAMSVDDRVRAARYDQWTGAFTVGGRTTAVFVERS